MCASAPSASMIPVRLRTCPTGRRQARRRTAAAAYGSSEYSSQAPEQPRLAGLRRRPSRAIVLRCCETALAGCWVYESELWEARPSLRACEGDRGGDLGLESVSAHEGRDHLCAFREFDACEHDWEVFGVLLGVCPSQNGVGADGSLAGCFEPLKRLEACRARDPRVVGDVRAGAASL